MGELWETIRGWVSENLSDFTMTKIYIGCAVAGGAVMIGQTGLSLFGFGGDGDVDPDVDVDDLDGADSLSFLSVRALAGFLTFFGLVGWTGVTRGWDPLVSALVAFAAGASVMLLVAVMMRFFKRMGSSGTVRIENTVGLTGTVYLKVPGEKSGRGKVTLSVQGQSREFEATTAGPELPTGAECRVVRTVTDTLVEVEPLS